MKFSLVKEEFEKLLSDIAEKAEIDWIFCSVLGKTRSELRTLEEISPKHYAICKKIVFKRRKGVPLDKIFGKSNFYGLDFIVNENVLIPRPETELLCEHVLSEPMGKGLDIGTGSGAIAIVLSFLGGHEMTAVDVSKKALAVAKKNAKIHKVDINFVLSDMFSEVKGKFDFIVSNPPYIKTLDIEDLQPEVKDHEPTIALDGGRDGLKFYREIAESAPAFLKKNGKLFMEIGYDQGTEIMGILKHNFTDIQVIKDYSGLDRIVIATKKSGEIK